MQLGQHDDVGSPGRDCRGAVRRTHALGEHAPSDARPPTPCACGACGRGAKAHDVRARERAWGVQSDAMRAVGQRQTGRGPAGRSRGGRRCSLSILWHSPAINLTLVLLLFATAGTWMPGTAAAAVDVCGNGRIVKDAGETCDDGNLIAGDGCSDICTVECGFLCSSIWGDDLSDPGFFNSSCVVEHGDGKRQLDEQCDDSNLQDGDGCSCRARGPSEDSPGCFVEPRWECTEVASIDINCASRVPMGDKCACIVREGIVTHAALPLLRQPERTELVTSGFAGASSYVKCGSCTCDHYGDCGAGAYCNYKTTCSGNGFCDGDGKCVCFGNFTGDACNRCKCNHYGPTCSTYCDPAVTCGGHGVCDFDGNCQWSPMCEGIPDLKAEVCGDGLRLGHEECDDGNSISGDGCSSDCRVEAGFRCMGGCSQTGDAKVTYGECRRDSCVALPCGFHLTDLSQDYSQGALSVVTPQFVTKSVRHSSPLANFDNLLRITLTSTVDIPRCIRSTLTVDEPVPTRPWLMRKRELTTSCQRSRITISGLTGVSNAEAALGEQDDAVVQNPDMIRIRTMAATVDETEPFDYFGICFGYTDERTAMGLCDETSTGAREPLVGAGHFTHTNTGSAFGGEAAISFAGLLLSLLVARAAKNSFCGCAGQKDSLCCRWAVLLLGVAVGLAVLLLGVAVKRCCLLRYWAMLLRYY